MKLHKKFTLYTIMIFVLLTASGVLAIIYGLTEMAGEPGNDGTGWSLGKAVNVYFYSLQDDPLKAARLVFYAISLFGFSAVLFMALYLRRRLMKPLLNAVDFAFKLADNQFPPKLEPPPGDNEMNELITSLNFMRDRLQSTFLKLKTSHENERNARFSAEIVTQMKSGFIRNLMPDLLEDIDVIANYNEILRRGISARTEKDRTHLYSGLQAALITLERHFQQLQEFSRIGVERHPAAPQSFRSADFLTQTVKSNAPNFALRMIRLEEEYHSSTPPILSTDESTLRMLIELAILAIANNSESGESIVCSSYMKDNSVIFSIRDLKQTRPRLPLCELFAGFQPESAAFEEVDQCLTTLAVINDWAPVIDGRMTLVGDNPESNLEIQLEFNPDEITGSQISGKATSSRRLSTISDADINDDSFKPVPAKLLAVEANTAFLATMRTLLEADKHECHFTPDIANLLKAAEQESYDMIIISLHISRETLLEVIKSLRAIPANKKTPLFVLTANPADLQDRELRSKVKYMFTRPVNYKSVRQIVGRCRDLDSDTH